jgi:uncharacterized protein (TIGR03435 family)
MPEESHYVRQQARGYGATWLELRPYRPWLCPEPLAKDLEKRIVRVMTRSPRIKLGFGRKLMRRLMLATLDVAVLAIPVICGYVSAPQVYAQSPRPGGVSSPSFEVASVKQNRSENSASMMRVFPDGFSLKNGSTKALVTFAYGVRDNQVSGEPGWITTERYDVEAKVGDSVLKELERLSAVERAKQLSLVAQALLAERFKLSVSNQTKEVPVYALVVANDGPKFSETTANPIGSVGNSPQGQIRALRIRLSRGEIDITGGGIGDLAKELSKRLGREVLDKTGLKGNYDLTLRWPDESQAQPSIQDSRPLDPPGPSLFAAIQEQLGLKLESQKGPVRTLVLEHIEKPSEN